MANGEQQKESVKGSLSTVVAEFWNEVRFFPFLPGLPGPLAASGVPSPWAAEKCA